MRYRQMLTVSALTAVAAVAATEAAAAHASSANSRSGANIYVVASKSVCIASGISDAYTGEGKIIFYLTLKNSAGVTGKVNIVPVRHYDDGGVNESAMDMLIDVEVRAHATSKFRSPTYKYKAHEHEIAACGVKIDGRKEVRIASTHL
jgi:hypothetical protein